MKQFLFIAISALLLSAYGCASGHYVAEQPGAVVITRPVAPGPNYVWVDGDYYWTGGRYVQRPGYWARPRPGRVWHGGSWARSPRGYYWHRGGWH